MKRGRDDAGGVVSGGEVEVCGVATAERSLCKSVMHRLPCRISADGPAPVEQYFKVESSGGMLYSTFRGRKLMGDKVKLPGEAVGLVLEPRVEFEQKSETHWDCHAVFDEITFW
eukprot:CAMPEP_0203766318 /NCGR_PEP_ID=MMETSP0099_2-20121227/345_1 /ASSEMBLY_ACC=CAM_ASM_000209 /TAXON_ID=96639 /ORGANISM=" , Strain NY0313808BC1" /LENGTH=113 /DNA_ID=CAMNT_0050662643 /DNA_START=303 /DNA_END=641 /DNA_ORIENTATION=+